MEAHVAALGDGARCGVVRLLGQPRRLLPRGLLESLRLRSAEEKSAQRTSNEITKHPIARASSSTRATTRWAVSAHRHPLLHEQIHLSVHGEDVRLWESGAEAGAKVRDRPHRRPLAGDQQKGRTLRRNRALRAPSMSGLLVSTATCMLFQNRDTEPRSRKTKIICGAGEFASSHRRKLFAGTRSSARGGGARHDVRRLCRGWLEG